MMVGQPIKVLAAYGEQLVLVQVLYRPPSHPARLRDPATLSPILHGTKPLGYDSSVRFAPKGQPGFEATPVGR